MFRCSPPIVPITWRPRSCFCDCCGANACVIAFVVGGSPIWLSCANGATSVCPTHTRCFHSSSTLLFFPGKFHLLMKLQQRAAIEVIHAHSLLPMQRMDQPRHKNFITSQVQSTNSWKQKLLPVYRTHLDTTQKAKWLQTTQDYLTTCDHFDSSEIHLPIFHRFLSLRWEPHDDLNWPQHRRKKWSTRYKQKSRKAKNSADLCHGSFLQVSSIEGLKKTKGG